MHCWSYLQRMVCQNPHLSVLEMFFRAQGGDDGGSFISKGIHTDSLMLLWPTREHSSQTYHSSQAEEMDPIHRLEGEAGVCPPPHALSQRFNHQPSKHIRGSSVRDVLHHMRGTCKPLASPPKNPHPSSSPPHFDLVFVSCLHSRLRL